MSHRRKISIKSATEHLVGDTNFIAGSKCVQIRAGSSWRGYEAGYRCHVGKRPEELRNPVIYEQQKWLSV